MIPRPPFKDPYTGRLSSIERVDLLSHHYLQGGSQIATTIEIRERLANLERGGA